MRHNLQENASNIIKIAQESPSRPNFYSYSVDKHKELIRIAGKVCGLNIPGKTISELSDYYKSEIGKGWKQAFLKERNQQLYMPEKYGFCACYLSEPQIAKEVKNAIFQHIKLNIDSLPNMNTADTVFLLKDIS